MAELRIGRGWSSSELEDRLARLDGLPASFPDPDLETMTPARGWTPERLREPLGRERCGPPEPGGLFERAWDAVADFQFSDPQIVTGHFVAGSRLLGRRMLLEIKVLGLRYLCGVVVGAVNVERIDGCTRRGFRYDSLAGHLEEGSEWFEVEKDHVSGKVWLHVRSRWRRGTFPNWWSRVGFALLSGGYRALWLRRAHQRLEAFVNIGPRALEKEELMRHRGTSTSRLPRTEALSARSPETLLAAAGAGALAGMRSISAPALVAARAMVNGPRAGAGRAERLLARPGTTALLGTLAVAEMVSDKLPQIPDRTSAPAFAGRVASGAASGWALGRERQRRPWAAAVTGAASAGVATVVSHRLRVAAQRRGLGGQVTLGLLEDAVVFGGAALLWRMLSRR